MIRQYPGRVLGVSTLLILASLAEVVGISTLFPLLAVISGNEETRSDWPPLLIDTVARHGEQTVFIAGLVTIVVAIALKAGLQILALRAAGYAQSQVARDLRLRISDAILAARWSFFSSQPTGTTINNIAGEPDRAAQCFLSLTRFLAAAFQVLIYGTLAIFTSIWVTLAAAILAAALYGSIRFLIRWNREASHAQTIERAALSKWLHDLLVSIKGLKAMELEKPISTMIVDGSERLMTQNRKAVLSKAIVQNLFEPAYVLLAAIGLGLFTLVYPTPIAKLLFVAVIYQRLMVYSANLIKALQVVQGDSVVLKELWDRIDAIEAEPEPSGHRPIAGDWDVIRLSGIRIAYDGPPVFDGFSAEIPRHALTLIKGPSGTGKSTLIDLVTGLRRPDSGQVVIGGVDLADADLADWRRRIGYVPQDPFLLNDSLRTNIQFFDPAVGDAAIHEALDRAGLKTTVEDLPEGLDTGVGERGDRFSGGQRQRIAIARALARNPQILLLDEATSALDPATSIALTRTIAALKSRMTVIAVSHGTDFDAVADYVIDLGPVS